VRRALAALALWLVAPGAVRAADRPLAAPLAAQRAVPDTVRFDQVIATGSLVHMTVTNYGFYGNNFFKPAASLEYPANRGIEHMVRGGLWVGARAQDQFGEFLGVTTGSVDAVQGPTSPDGSEFTPGGKSIRERSILITSEFFDRAAVSELDVVSDFNDDTPTVATSNPEPHRPMHIAVHHENYQWSFGGFKHCLFFHITIRNERTPLESLWVGIYTEFSSGNKGHYTRWPPTFDDPTGDGSWFNRKWIAYDDSLRLSREHYCKAPPIPEGCSVQTAPYWIGLRLLGSRGLVGDTTTRKVTYAAWNWQATPPKPDRDQDRERYRFLSAGTIQDVGQDSLQIPGSGGSDPVEVLAAGPFPIVYHDSTVTVDFALVGGAQVSDLQLNSRTAQFAYDHNYVVPIPPPSPRMHLVPRERALDVYWDNVSESAYDVTSPDPHDFEGYRVNIGEDPDTLARVAQYDSNVFPGDSTGFNTGFGAVRLPIPVAFDGVTYQYRTTVTGLRDGFKYYCAVTAYDRGTAEFEPLESSFEQNRVIAIPGPAPGQGPDDTPRVFPNPYRVEARWDVGKSVRDHYLWFTNLPKRCKLGIFTLSGDLVFEQEFDGATYRGEGARGIFDPSKSLGKPVLSGSTFGWNLITREGQAVATGLYLFTVEDRGSGKRHVGKFLIVKSDREGQ
jgi:hypothetical protein